jgi:hypothetical protein
MSTRSVAIRLGGAAVLAGATLIAVGSPALARVAPEPDSGDVRVVALTQPVPVHDIEVTQIGIGALAGAAIAGVGVAASRATRRPHVRPA